MQTLETFWTEFFAINERALLANYPGITLRRWLRDLEDICRFQTGLSQLKFAQANSSLNAGFNRGLQEDLLSGTPLSVLMGHAEFMGHQFYVTKKVLIPRPETEFLTDLLVQEFRGKALRVLDVGVGSGAILLSLMSHGVVESGVGVDISEDALAVAKVNARRMRLNPELILSDRLNSITGSFELIVSNPPYIRASAHRSLVHSSVNTHEPHEALFLPDAEYESWFMQLFEGVKKHLRGWFFMEGHELEVDRQATILSSMGFTQVEVILDLSQRPRFIRAAFGN